MDAFAYLGIMAKAKLVFENPDTFMSFPVLSPLQYTADQLTFGSFSSPAVSERLVYSEFSRVVNSSPPNTIFEVGDKYLWEIYGNILAPGTTIVADDQVSEDE